MKFLYVGKFEKTDKNWENGSEIKTNKMFFILKYAQFFMIKYKIGMWIVESVESLFGFQEVKTSIIICKSSKTLQSQPNQIMQR